MTANIFVLMLTFLGIAAAQWYLSERLEEKSINNAVFKVKNFVFNLVDERLNRAELIASTILGQPGTVLAVKSLKAYSDQEPISRIVTRLLGSDRYRVVITDQEGAPLYKSEREQGGRPRQELDYRSSLLRLDDVGSLWDLVIHENEMEIHYYQFIREHEQVLGVLDVIFIIDDSLAEYIAGFIGSSLMGDWSSEAPPVSESIGAPLTSSFSGRTARTEHYLAFLDNSGRPVAVSFRGDPGVTFQEDALVSRGVTYDTYRDTVDVKGFPIGLALYSDFYDLTQARWTTFKTTIGVVLAVVIVVLFIANYL
ncbi:MAG: hypothetical protein AB1896_20150, partial [Thermodesulfobacteriota bacterium]